VSGWASLRSSQSYRPGNRHQACVTDSRYLHMERLRSVETVRPRSMTTAGCRETLGGVLARPGSGPVGPGRLFRSAALRGGTGRSRLGGAGGAHLAGPGVVAGSRVTGRLGILPRLACRDTSLIIEGLPRVRGPVGQGRSGREVRQGRAV